MEEVGYQADVSGTAVAKVWAGSGYGVRKCLKRQVESRERVQRRAADDEKCISQVIAKMSCKKEPAAPRQ